MGITRVNSSFQNPVPIPSTDRPACALQSIGPSTMENFFAPTAKPVAVPPAVVPTCHGTPNATAAPDSATIPPTIGLLPLLGLLSPQVPLTPIFIPGYGTYYIFGPIPAGSPPPVTPAGTMHPQIISPVAAPSAPDPATAQVLAALLHTVAQSVPQSSTDGPRSSAVTTSYGSGPSGRRSGTRSSLVSRSDSVLKQSRVPSCYSSIGSSCPQSHNRSVPRRSETLGNLLSRPTSAIQKGSAPVHQGYESAGKAQPPAQPPDIRSEALGCVLSGPTSAIQEGSALVHQRYESEGEVQPPDMRVTDEYFFLSLTTDYPYLNLEGQIKLCETAIHTVHGANNGGMYFTEAHLTTRSLIRQF
jgi:hypothetical protein